RGSPAVGIACVRDAMRRPRRAPALLLDGERAGAGGRPPARVTVSVIIVNWNAGQDLDACLASLAAGGGPAPEMVLVDNPSGEGGGWQPAAARFAPLAHLLLDTTLGRLGARLRRAPHRVDWVYGTFMAVRRDLFRRLGGFDPRYFLYGEDLDLCYRAARLGAC